MTATLVSPRAEVSIVGAVLSGSPRLADAVLDIVAPADFDDPKAKAVLEAVSVLRSKDVSPDPRAVAERLRAVGKLDLVGGEVGVDAMCAEVVAVGAVGQLCADVANLAKRRRRLAATQMLTHAAQILEDDHAWEEALAALNAADAPGRTAGGWLSPHDLASELVDSLNGGDPVRWPWPLERLNRLSGGGARRGQLTFIGGASSHGKSAFVDGAMQSMARRGRARAGLFLNEMTSVERAERIAANLANVRYSRLQRASAGLEQLSPQEAQTIVKAMSAQPVGMVPCANWTIEQIIREARRRRLDVMALDIVQKLPFQPGVRRHQTLEEAVQRLDGFAKDTGCHVLIVGQINRERANGTFPMPGLADIKDCAELGNGPDNVLFVWREQDQRSLDPLDEGLVRMAKYRGSALESVPARFQGEYQRWVDRLVVT